MKITCLLLLFLTGITFALTAQKKLQTKTSIELLQDGLKFKGNNEPQKAEASFNSISINDTNYVLAQKELALLYMSMKEFEKSDKILTTLLNYESAFNNRASVYYILAQSYNGQEKYDASLELLEEGIKNYPMNHILYHVKGLTYEKKGEYQNALEAYKQAIQRNMNYYDAHMRLGILAANEGKYTEAMFSLLSCLMIEPKGEKSGDVVFFMEEIADGTFTPTKKGIVLSENGDKFDHVNLLFSNKVALQPKYKAKFTVSTSYARQLHLILSTLEYDGNDEGFWHRQYLSFYKNIYNAGQLDPMILFTLQSVTNEKTAKTVTSKKSVIDKFVKEATNYWSNNNMFQYLEFEGKKQKVGLLFKDSAPIVGVLTAENKPIGNWYYYHPQGNLHLIVPLNMQGEKDGVLKKYDVFTNNLIEETTYTKNIENGIQKKYFKSGEIEQMIRYKDGKMIDTVVNYYRGGQTMDIIPLKDNLRDGIATTYYENGQLKISTPFTAGELNGLYQTYHENGKLSVKVAVEKGVITGEKKSYYPNGQLEYEYPFKNDKVDGAFKKYYPNGQVEEEGKMMAGKYFGENVSYYSNGTVYSKGKYDEAGKENGVIEYFDSEGKKFVAFDFKKGSIQKIEVFDQQEKSIKTISKSGSKLKYENYYPTRHLLCEGEIIDDKRSGIWKYYDNYGVLQKTEKYKSGIIQDTVFTYFPNGNIQSIIQYKDDELDGIYLKYNVFGHLIQEGRYSEGEAVNDWYEYYPDGSLREEYAFNRGIQHGFYRNYAVNGKLENYEIYSDGISVASIYLDTNGMDMQRFGQFNGKIQLKDPSGTFVRFECHYNSGVIDGEAKWYDAKQQLITLGNFVNGKREGMWKWYDLNGKIWKKVDYINGKIHGELIEYYENGKILTRQKYQYGKSEGETVFYHNNGNKETEAVYIDDLRHGKVITYGYDGAVQQIRMYDRGVLISYSYLDKHGNELPYIPIEKGESSFIVYYQNGNKAVEQTRYNGKMNGVYKEYYSDGKLMTASNYYYGEPEGEYIQYHPNGNKKTEATYKNGELEGMYYEYHSNGILKMSSTYRFGELNGERKVYSEKGELIKTYIYYNDQMLEVN